MKDLDMLVMEDTASEETTEDEKCTDRNWAGWGCVFVTIIVLKMIFTSIINVVTG